MENPNSPTLDTSFSVFIRGERDTSFSVPTRGERSTFVWFASSSVFCLSVSIRVFIYFWYQLYWCLFPLGLSAVFFTACTILVILWVRCEKEEKRRFIDMYPVFVFYLITSIIAEMLICFLLYYTPSIIMPTIISVVFMFTSLFSFFVVVLQVELYFVVREKK